VYFDTHAHYDDEQFENDKDELLRSMPENNVSLIMNPASNMESAKKCIELSEKYDFIYAAVGVHPQDAKTWNDEFTAQLEKMAENKKVKAIGEIGLDYYYGSENKDIQKQALYEQLCLAEKVKLPVIIHERDACKDMLDILQGFKTVKGVFHCYSGSWETAKIILNKGWNISFTGAITFKNARNAPEVAEKMPSDRIMIETDSPYMSPVPVRGTRNNSTNLVHICEKIAQIRHITHEEAAKLTLENGKMFFNI